MSQRVEHQRPYPFRLQFQQDIKYQTVDGFRQNISPNNLLSG